MHKISPYNLYKSSEVIQYLCIGNRPGYFVVVYSVILVLFLGLYIRPKLYFMIINNHFSLNF